MHTLYDPHSSSFGVLYVYAVTYHFDCIGACHRRNHHQSRRCLWNRYNRIIQSSACCVGSCTPPCTIPIANQCIFQYNYAQQRYTSRMPPRAVACPFGISRPSFARQSWSMACPYTTLGTSRSIATVWPFVHVGLLVRVGACQCVRSRSRGRRCKAIFGRGSEALPLALPLAYLGVVTVCMVGIPYCCL